MKIICAYCEREADKPAGQVNRRHQAGRNVYCSQSCAALSRRIGKKAAGWHASRFIEDTAKIETSCAVCGQAMWFPASKAGKYKTCGGDCARSLRGKIERGERQPVGRRYPHIPLEQRWRECERCGKKFQARPWQIRNGIGRFCSQACNDAKAATNFDPQEQARRAARLAELRADGLINYRRGADSTSWKGGKAAHLKRRTESGKAAAGLRRYRKANPDKVREFAERRADRKIGRLPRGTIKRIGESQKWRCAICRKSIKKHYHLDHIMPLARGGLHVPANVQLLCGPCNLHKSSRDPIEHMQSLGRLL